MYIVDNTLNVECLRFDWMVRAENHANRSSSKTHNCLHVFYSLFHKYRTPNFWTRPFCCQKNVQTIPLTDIFINRT